MRKQLLQEKKRMAGFILALLFTSASSNPITLKQEVYLQIINAENGVLEAVFFTNATGIRISCDHSSISITSMTNDEVLMSGCAPSNSSRRHRVLGSNFLQETTTDENGERRKHQYIVAESMVDQTKEESEATRKEQRINLVRRSSNCAYVRITHFFYTKYFSTLQDSYVDPLKKFLATSLAVSLLL